MAAGGGEQGLLRSLPVLPAVLQLRMLTQHGNFGSNEKSRVFRLANCLPWSQGSSCKRRGTLQRKHPASSTPTALQALPVVGRRLLS